MRRKAKQSKAKQANEFSLNRGGMHEEDFFNCGHIMKTRKQERVDEWTVSEWMGMDWCMDTRIRLILLPFFSFSKG